MIEVKFKCDEVWAVANALLENSISHDVTKGRNAYNECNYCNSWVYWNEDSSKINHKYDCIVLIAKDLLTGAP